MTWVTLPSRAPVLGWLPGDRLGSAEREFVGNFYEYVNIDWHRSIEECRYQVRAVFSELAVWYQNKSTTTFGRPRVFDIGNSAQRSLTLHDSRNIIPSRISCMLRLPYSKPSYELMQASSNQPHNNRIVDVIQLLCNISRGDYSSMCINTCLCE